MPAIYILKKDLPKKDPQIFQVFKSPLFRNEWPYWYKCWRVLRGFCGHSEKCCFVAFPEIKAKVMPIRMSKLGQIQLPWKSRWVVLVFSIWMLLAELYESFLEWPWSNSWRFKFWRYWRISFPSKTFKMQMIADVGKISKTVQRNLMFILNVFFRI